MDDNYTMKKLLVTGSGGLIGSEATRYFLSLGWKVTGIDGNQRQFFFGPAGSTKEVVRSLVDEPEYYHWNVDIRDRQNVAAIVKATRPDAIVHCAAQPSHDRAASIPFDDFDTNAVGTLNLLEACRQSCPEAPFVFMSTNKVYGDTPNELGVWEGETRYHGESVDEDCPVDQCMHSLFGASKLAADILVQEYGRYFGMPTTCLRGGCLTGPQHAGVELHGFLSYLIKCNVTGTPYTIYGHGGKQVRDNLHSLDVARFIHAFIEAPRVAEVYNLGGGPDNSISIVEARQMIEEMSDRPLGCKYEPTPRKGDHIHYVSDLTKCREHYPGWGVTIGLPEIFQQIHAAQSQPMRA